MGLFETGKVGYICSYTVLSVSTTFWKFGISSDGEFNQPISLQQLHVKHVLRRKFLRVVMAVHYFLKVEAFAVS